MTAAENIEEFKSDLHAAIELIIDERFKKVMSEIQDIRQQVEALGEPSDAALLSERIEVTPFLTLHIGCKLRLDLRKSAITGVVEKVAYNSFTPAADAPSCTVLTSSGSFEVLETREKILEALGQGEL